MAKHNEKQAKVKETTQASIEFLIFRDMTLMVLMP